MKRYHVPVILIIEALEECKRNAPLCLRESLSEAKPLCAAGYSFNAASSKCSGKTKFISVFKNVFSPFKEFSVVNLVEVLSEYPT